MVFLDENSKVSLFLYRLLLLCLKAFWGFFVVVWGVFSYLYFPLKCLYLFSISKKETFNILIMLFFNISCK